MLTATLRAAPLIGSAVALLGALFAYGTARRAHTLAIRATAAEDRRGRSEETMRLLRWAVELAVGDEVRHRSAGMAVLGSLVKAHLVVRGDRALSRPLPDRFRAWRRTAPDTLWINPYLRNGAAAEATMAKVQFVDRAQVMAAQLAVEMAREDGREPDPLLVKIAEAKLATPEEMAAARDADD